MSTTEDTNTTNQTEKSEVILVDKDSDNSNKESTNINTNTLISNISKTIVKEQQQEINLEKKQLKQKEENNKKQQLRNYKKGNTTKEVTHVENRVIIDEGITKIIEKFKYSTSGKYGLELDESGEFYIRVFISEKQLSKTPVIQKKEIKKMYYYSDCNNFSKEEEDNENENENQENQENQENNDDSNSNSASTSIIDTKDTKGEKSSGEETSDNTNNTNTNNNNNTTKTKFTKVKIRHSVNNLTTSSNNKINIEGGVENDSNLNSNTGNTGNLSNFQNYSEKRSSVKFAVMKNIFLYPEEDPLPDFVKPKTAKKKGSFKEEEEDREFNSESGSGSSSDSDSNLNPKEKQRLKEIRERREEAALEKLILEEEAKIKKAEFMKEQEEKQSKRALSLKEERRKESSI